jgi:hypothetical protein
MRILLDSGAGQEPSAASGVEQDTDAAKAPLVLALLLLLLLLLLP